MRDATEEVLFGWMYPDEDKRMDGLTGCNWAIFRIESARRSSDIIMNCEAINIERWGPNRMHNYVNPAKIRSVDPGFCSKQPDWTNVWNLDGLVRISKAGQHL